jgi:hypothetical protein
VERSLERGFGEIEADDPVVAVDRIDAETVEDSGCDPLVASGPQGGV